MPHRAYLPWFEKVRELAIVNSLGAFHSHFLPQQLCWSQTRTKRGSCVTAAGLLILRTNSCYSSRSRHWWITLFPPSQVPNNVLTDRHLVFAAYTIFSLQPSQLANNFENQNPARPYSLSISLNLQTKPLEHSLVLWIFNSCFWPAF